MLIHPKLSCLLCQACDICQLWRFSTLEGIHSHIWKHACILKIVPNIVTIISKQEASTDQENIYKQRQSWQESPWRREVMTWQFNRLLDLFITCWWAKHTTLSKFDTQADLKSCAVLIIQYRSMVASLMYMLILLFQLEDMSSYFWNLHQSDKKCLVSESVGISTHWFPIYTCRTKLFSLVNLPMPPGYRWNSWSQDPVCPAGYDTDKSAQWDFNHFRQDEPLFLSTQQNWTSNHASPNLTIGDFIDFVTD